MQDPLLAPQLASKFKVRSRPPQNERFDDALDLGTSLTLAAPAAGDRDPTPSSAMGKGAGGHAGAQDRRGWMLVQNSSRHASRTPQPLRRENRPEDHDPV